MKLSRTRRVDLTGRKFGHLEVVYSLPTIPKKPTRCLCYCGLCGRYKTYAQNQLTGGHTIQCGCSPKRGRLCDAQDWHSMDYQYSWDAYIVSFNKGKSGPVLGGRIVHPQTEKEPRPQNINPDPERSGIINNVKSIEKINMFDLDFQACDITGRPVGVQEYRDGLGDIV